MSSLGQADGLTVRRGRAGARRRRLGRIDALVGLLLAVAAVLLAPGLAVVGIGAVLVLAACAITFVFQLRSERKAGR